MKKSIDNIVNHARVSEKAIERYLMKRVKELGGKALKYSNPAETGYPDRLVVYIGEVFFVELKSKDKKPTKAQELRIEELRRLGARCYVCDSKEAVDEVISKEILKA